MPPWRPIRTTAPVGGEAFSGYVNAGGSQCFQDQNPPSATAMALQANQLGHDRSWYVDAQLGPCSGGARVCGGTIECRTRHTDANQGQCLQHELADRRAVRARRAADVGQNCSRDLNPEASGFFGATGAAFSQHRSVASPLARRHGAGLPLV